jgi:hypothetical protein
MSFRFSRSVGIAGLCLCIVGFVPASLGGADASLRALALKAVSTDPAEASAAVAQLRTAGPAGLDALFEVHAGQWKPAFGLVERTAQEAEDWKRLAADARLDEWGKALMRKKTISAAEAARVARSKMMIEDPLLRVLVPFERSLAEDTVRNEYVLHARIHERLATGKQSAVDELNEWVYGSLFLTPSSDPWLGLVPADTYSALAGNGLRWGLYDRNEK